MLRRFSTDFAIFSMLIDGLLVAAALRLAASLRPQLDEILPFLRPLSQESIVIEAWLYILFPVIWVGVLLLLNTYDARKNLQIFDELANFTLGSVLAAVVLAGTLYLSYRDISRGLFVFFIFLAFFALLLIRIFYRVAFNTRMFRSIQTRRVLVVGAGVGGMRAVAHMDEYVSLGLEFVGFVDDDPLYPDNPKLLGNLDQVLQVITEHHIDDVILAMPSEASAKIKELVPVLHRTPIRLWVVPDYYALALNRAQVEDFAGLPMIDLRAPALNDFQRILKRIMDIAIVVFSLPITVPLMAIISLAIRLDSPGPVFFRQPRAGENKKLFTMLKFRTMVQDAEKQRHVVEQVDENGRIHLEKTAADPRITRVGRFLRRTSLDELPQLINVFKGEMSLVGPRPELPYLVDQYEIWQYSRFAIPQGMTGWWQVNGRADKPLQDNTEDDIYYVQHYSLLLDIVILIRTVWVVITRKGAY